MAEEELAIAERVTRLALEAGANEAEATCTVARRFSVEARDREVVKVEQAVARGIGLRVFLGGAKAALSTSDLSHDGLRDAVARTVEAARYVGADPHAGLPETAPIASGDLAIDAGDVRMRPHEAKVADALALERIVREDHRIVNSSGSRVADVVTTIALANSRGAGAMYRASQASVGSSPIARDGDDKRTASYGSAARSYAALEPVHSVAATAARRATDAIGARKPATMRCAVIFERDVAALVLSDLFAAVKAANVAIGNSFLSRRIGDAIGSDRVTIVDDGRLRAGLGTSPFDAEGVPTRRTVVFERGVLRTFLYDTYYARRLGASTTGNASGGGVGPTNFMLLPGDASLAELVATTACGILVTDTIGFATESVTGTYSRGARGFVIEGGELAYPVDEFTIASDLVSMLAGVDAVADDLVLDQNVVSPSFRVAEMTVSGA